MKTHRIVTDGKRFKVQSKCSVLWNSWWSDLGKNTFYFRHGIAGTSFSTTYYDTIEEAKSSMDKSASGPTEWVEVKL